MKYTNKQGLPEALFLAIANDPYEKDSDFSASELPGPIQIWVLRKRYTNEITTDVSDLIYPLIGNNTHYILERMGIKNGLQEERLKFKMGNWVVSGKLDFYDSKKILWDYKVTTRWVLIDGVKPEWEGQMNINAWLLKMNNFGVNGANVCAMFRDWSKIQAMKNPDYPKHQVAILPVKLWESQDVWEYVEDQITRRMSALNLSDENLPECTPEERWEKPTIYAVMKKGRKSSVRNLITFELAQEYIENNQLDTNIHSIQVRPGESTRCEYYCDVKNFCQQYKIMKED